jgi:hypothetical protein
MSAGTKHFNAYHLHLSIYRSFSLCLCVHAWVCVSVCVCVCVCARVCVDMLDFVSMCVCASNIVFITYDNGK